MSRQIVKYVTDEVTDNWDSIQDVKDSGFSEADVVAMCVRYQAAQTYARDHREKAKLTAEYRKQRLAELEKVVARMEASRQES